MAGFSSVTGDEAIMFADNVSFNGTQRGGKLTTDGQLLIGSTTSPHIKVGTLSSSDGSITITSGSGTISLKNSLGPSRFPVTPYVVGPVAHAGYQTIQSALDAANLAGSGIVVIQPGTYTENLTLYNGINVMGLNFADAGGGVTIIGVHTPPTTGGFVFRNVALTSLTDIFSSNAAGSAHLVIGDAIIAVTNGYTFNLPNWTGKLESFDVNAAVGTADGYVNNTAGSEVDIFECSIGSGTTNPMIVSGFTLGAGSNLYCPIQFRTGSNAQFDYSDFNSTVTFSNNSTGALSSTIIRSGSSAAITMNSSGNWTLINCTLVTSNNPAIAGTGIGTLTLGSISFIGNKNIAGTLTLAGTTGYLPTNLTLHGVVIGEGVGCIASTAAGSSGQVLQSGGASADPSYSTATYPSTTTVSQILYSSSTNTVTGLATANRAVLTTGATGIPVLTALATDGQVIIGSTAGVPSAATLTAGTGISITNASNSITIANTQSFIWTDVTTATQALLVFQGYVTDRGGGVTYTLPATASLGDEIIIVGKLGLTTIAQNANQAIRMSSSISTTGVGGSVAGTNLGDCITLVCTTAGASTIWIASSFVGNWTIT